MLATNQEVFLIAGAVLNNMTNICFWYLALDTVSLQVDKSRFKSFPTY